MQAVAGEDNWKTGSFGGLQAKALSARVSSHRLELGGGAACDAMRCTTELNLAQSHFPSTEYDSLGESEMERSARGQKQLLAPLAASTKALW